MIKRGIDLKKVVVITFTRKAGNELKYRINNLMPNSELGFVGTFHGFANHISQLNGFLPFSADLITSSATRLGAVMACGVRITMAPSTSGSARQISSASL